MRWLGLVLLGLVLGAPVPFASASEPSPRARVFVEIVTPATPVFVHQPFVVGVRFGVDRDFFEQRAAQLFRTALEVPVALTVPWWHTLPGHTPAPATERRQLVLNTQPAEARVLEDRVVDGRAFSVFQIDARARASAAGAIELSAPRLRFAHATRFEEDFVGGRVPVDRKDVTVQGAPATVQVRALPDAGRPPSYVDAVGFFEVRAAASRTSLDVGEPFELTLRIEGAGNLASLTPPALRDLPGFHRYGMRDDGGAEVRTLTYELAPLRADVQAVPPLAFAFFDPGPPSGYVVVRTQPIPLEVEAVGGARPADPAPATAPPPGRAHGWLWGLLALLVLAALGFFVARSRRRQQVSVTAPAPARDEVRIAAATRALQASPPRATEQGFALAEWLAAHLQCPPAAVVTPNLADKLQTAGVSAALATQTAAAMERLVAARYGGAKDVQLSPDLTAALQDALRR